MKYIENDITKQMEHQKKVFYSVPQPDFLKKRFENLNSNAKREKHKEYK